MTGPKPSDDRSTPEDSAEDSHSITRMIEKLRSEKHGEFDQAAAAIWTRYFSDLLHLARRNLSPGLRQREDEDDLLQSVYKSFCLRQRDGQFDLEDRADLWSLLVKITRNKARNVAVRHGRKRRDYRRESHPTEKADTGGSDYEPLDVAGPGAAPYDQMIFGEALQQIAALDESLQKLALWKLAGFTNEEIASEKMMHCALRTVERKLNRIREIWEKP
jgi:hypothetical protein